MVNVMEMRNVDYTDIPNAIRKFKANGYSVNDIYKIRVNCRTYNLIAQRKEN